MERKIGETFEFEGKKLQVKEDKYRTCNDCFFNIICTDESLNIGGYCDENCRKDGKNVIFTEVIEEQKLNLCEILKYCPKGFKLYSAIHGEVTFFSIEDGMYPICVLTNNNNGTEYFSSSGKLYESCGECLLFPSKDQRDWSKFMASWYKKEKFDPKTLKPFDRVIIRHDACSEWEVSLFSHRYIYDVENLYAFRTVTGICVDCIPYNDDTKYLVGTTDEAPEFYKYWED